MSTEGRSRRLAAHAAAGALILLHAALADRSLEAKSPTFDETAHLVAGFSYWETGDFRLNPESGVLPQLWAGLVPWLGGARSPDFSGAAWESGDDWSLARAFLYEVGNDPGRLLRCARRSMLLLGAALGGVVYALTLRRYGAGAGLLALWLYAFCPNALAHARLVTADIAFSLAFTLATATSWELLERPRPAALIGCGAAVAVLFLTKFGALAFLPVAAGLALLRWVDPQPLELPVAGRPPVSGRAGRAALLSGCGVAVALLVAIGIWAVHALAGGGGAHFHWERVEEMGGPGAALLIGARDRGLLPESWLYGFGYTLDTTRERVAFAAGEVGSQGWWWYFPYAVAVKTPLGTLALFALAAGSALLRGLPAEAWPAVRRAAPWLSVLIVYGGISLGSQINIGVRHLLPMLPAALILTGSLWARWNRPVARGLLAVLALATALETLAVHPHYLAFFNRAAGGPAEGYRRLVDSNLDWGQDLPGLAAYLEGEGAGAPGSSGATPCYLAYFGSVDPAAYGISCRLLPGFFDLFRERSPHPLRPGLFLVSATLLPMLYAPEVLRGAWTADNERRLAVVREELERRGPAEGDWDPLLEAHERLRSARLLAALREREPDAAVGHSILVYRLDADQLRAALRGPLRALEAGGSEASLLPR